jgi:hypothetical protein
MSSIRLCSFILPPTLSPSVSSVLARHTRFRHEFIWQTVCRLCLFTAGSGAARARAPVSAFVIVISLLSFFLSLRSPSSSPLGLGGWREKGGVLSAQCALAPSPGAPSSGIFPAPHPLRPSHPPPEAREASRAPSLSPSSLSEYPPPSAA